MPDFCHLHSHSQYSLLDGAASVKDLVRKAEEDQMKAVAITDHGNMFGVFQFYLEAQKTNVTPILGCEFYVVEDRFQKKFTREKRDKRYHQLLLAKNPEGYKNLSKLCSLGFIEGLYGKFPRVDKELIRKYKDGLIATTCCLAAEVPRTFLRKGEEEAEQIFREWLEIFGEDYYIEIQRHGIEDQNKVNEFLLKLAKKYEVKVIATNDSHYVDQEDYEAHDVLLCVETGSDINDPKRFRFENDQFFFKTKAEMLETFRDIPEALDNTMEIVSKIEPPELKRDVLLPNYTLPENFKDQNEYLKHISLEGARKRYGEVTQDIVDRLDYELKVIREMNFPGYFLIVQDFVAAARNLNVAVGPGRGSAAGSAVAYCTGITNIDPIKYNLLFERFLNPERVSMPDIDIDFDDDGRQKVIEYVIDKYGKNQVAQIITFGTMAARSAIRDVGRVLQYPLPQTDALAKQIPERPGVTLKEAFKEIPELLKIKDDQNDLAGKTLKLAETLEGSVRHRGIHAAGVIIAPDDITDYIPVCTSKDSDLLVTQFDGKIIEDAGMLKMDFLGLKTLSIINDAVRLIKERHNKNINPDEIPLDDEETMELYQRGDTIGTFQFESDGMRKYLKELKPTNIEDLIAMNALYRPGPMDYIPDFIERKHGRQKVEYPHELIEEILKPTFGIMVYQEQIMQTAQKIGGFSLGKADILRRAMGKKKTDVMQGMKEEFVKGAAEKNIDQKKAVEIFDIMAKFASYGFNRSHAAAYSVLAFQTAYLKANYPAEYMAGVLTHNMNDIKKVNFFLDEARKMGIEPLGPDINESHENFTVNEEGKIRFALSAIKGVGSSAVVSILEERQKNGHFNSIFDFTKRISLRAVNKRCIESLVLAGAFDNMNAIHRAQYFAYENGEDINLIERAVKYGNHYQKGQETMQNSLFGEAVMVETEMPSVPDAEPWPLIKKLQKEKEVTGIYLSGHPLDDYELEVKSYCNCRFEELERFKNRSVSVAGIVTQFTERMNKKGQPFGLFTVEDYSGAGSLALFGEDYLKWKHLLEPGTLVYIKGAYEQRYKSEGRFNLRIHSMQLLSQLRNKESGEIELTLEVSDITEDFITRIEELGEKYAGKHLLKFKIVDALENYSIEVFANNHRLEINDEVVKFLKQFPDGHCVLK